MLAVDQVEEEKGNLRFSIGIAQIQYSTCMYVLTNTATTIHMLLLSAECDNTEALVIASRAPDVNVTVGRTREEQAAAT
jgi:hypothetical protein